MHVIMVRFKERRKGRENALCLGDKLMKLADKILEDELYATAHRVMTRRYTYENGRNIMIRSRTGLVRAQ